MDTEAHHRLVATMIAHERILAFLLSDYLKRLSPAQRVVIESSMAGSDMARIPDELKLDIDTADQLAGLAMSYRDSMNRLFRAALEIADAQKS